MSNRSSRRPPNSSLFVRGIDYSTKSEELRELFNRYGPVSDVYVPMDYYTREPRGFAYVQFEDLRDAEDALHHLDGHRLNGKRMEIQYAQGDRKTPQEMRHKERGGSGGRRRYSRSRSRSPRRGYSSRRHYSPSWSPSPERKRGRSRSPHYRGDRSYSRSPRRSNSRSRSPYGHSPPYD